MKPFAIESLPFQATKAQEYRAQALAESETLIHALQGVDRAGLKEYQKVCRANQFQVEGFKFNGIYGEVEIAAPLVKCIQTWLRFRADVNEKSPKKLLEATIFQKLFWLTKEDEAQYAKVMQGQLGGDICFGMHSATRSPSMFVSHRDFVAVGAIRFTPGKCCISIKGIPCEQLLSGAERGFIHNTSFCFTENGGRTTVQQYSLADPAGSLPLAIYNSALESRNDFLVLLKDAVEGKVTVE